ncbi:MAG: hypothetical protein AAF802_01815 [Planctomycetota bacterium]
MPALKNAFAKLRDTMAAVNGEPITYKFGDLEISVPDARRGRSNFIAESGDGSETEVRLIDWIISRGKLIDAQGVLQEPSIGATITDWDGCVYVVVPGQDPTGWRWTDSYRTSFRIHTISE